MSSLLSKHYKVKNVSVKYVTAYNDRIIDNLVRKGRISQDDAVLIKDYLIEREIAGISNLKLKNDAYSLINIRRTMNKDLRVASIHDLMRALKTLRDKGLMQSTVMQYSVNVTPFFLWLIENGHTDALSVYDLKKIRMKRPKSRSIKKEELLEKGDIPKMIQACKNSRDRAIIAVLYESAFRAIELCTLTWSQVTFDDYGVVFNAGAKTEQTRYIRCVMCRDYLAQWRNDYPGEIKPDSYVFVTTYGNQISYLVLRKIILKNTNRAGIDGVRLHLFRHSRITHMYQDGISEGVIKMTAWGSMSTNMLGTYAHLHNADIDREILTKAGVTAPQTRARSFSLAPRQCPHCLTMNSPSANYCATCGKPMDEQAQQTVDQCIKIATDSQEYRDLLESLKKELRSA